MMLDTGKWLVELDRTVRALAGASSPADTFKMLLEGSRLATPRAAFFLTRQGNIRGWGSMGYDPSVSQQQRAFASAVQGWPAALIANPEIRAQSRPASTHEPDFGQPAAADAVGLVVRIKQKPVALLVIERGTGESPWWPQALSTLVTVAQLRLDLDLAARKLKGATSPEPQTRETIEHGASSSISRTMMASPPSLPEISVETSAPARAGAPSQPSREIRQDPPQLQAARRFARLVATDIQLYNEEAVTLGRQQGDLVRRLGEQLGRGKETFLRRHGDLGPTGLQILHEAYVAVLAGGNAQLLPTSILD